MEDFLCKSWQTGYFALHKHICTHHFEKKKNLFPIFAMAEPCSSPFPMQNYTAGFFSPCVVHVLTPPKCQ